MITNLERPPQTAEARTLPAPGGLSPSGHTDEQLAPHPPADRSRAGDDDAHAADGPHAGGAPAALTLSSLPVGARLVVRCRKDWRVATVSSIEPGCVRLNVASPTGHTYRLRRPHDAPLTCEGALPLLGELTPAGWRAALARYDARW